MALLDPATRAQYQHEVSRLETLKKDLRRQERSLAVREGTLGAASTSYTPGSQAQLAAGNGGQDLRSSLAKMLPVHMMPGNVGGYNTVMWPFWFQLDFDFGVNPTLTDVIRRQSSFQVTQEACLLLLSISRMSYSDTTSGKNGPYTLNYIKDRQSSRQFNDRPIPWQMIGENSGPTVLPTAMLFMPNATVEIEMGTWLATGQSQITVGSGKHQLSCFGYRVRVEDAEKVLSSVFSVGGR